MKSMGNVEHLKLFDMNTEYTNINNSIQGSVKILSKLLTEISNKVQLAKNYLNIVDSGTTLLEHFGAYDEVEKIKEQLGKKLK